MNTLLIILGINAVLLGFAFVFGGFMVVSAPSREEIDALDVAARSEQVKSWWRGQLFALRYAAAARYRGVEMFIEHWPERPQGRRLVYVGAFCLAIAAAIGYHFDVFAP